MAAIGPISSRSGHRSKPRKSFDLTSLIGLSTGAFGFVYVTGYLVMAAYYRGRGIADLPLLQTQYFESGATFLLLTFILGVMPLLLRQMIAYFRLEAGQPTNFMSRVFALEAGNYIFIMVFLSVFVTHFEWQLSASLWGIHLPFKVVIPLYLFLMFFVLTGPMMLRRSRWVKPRNRNLPYLDRSLDRLQTMSGIKITVYLLRSIGIVVTFAVDLYIFCKVRWLPRFLIAASPYIVTVVFFLAAGFVIWMVAQFFHHSNKRVLGILAGAPAVLLCYYLCIRAYSHSVFHNVPMNRGGGYPTAVAIRESGYVSGASTSSNSVYIIAQNDKDVYFIRAKDVDDWFDQNHVINCRPRASFGNFTLERTQAGEPRFNHLRSSK